MLVDGLIFADERMIPQLRSDRAPEQVANVACLPGIQMASLAMPDIHWGYGFCIGGVCATDPAIGGVVSPGGVGYDINCGVRLLRTNLAQGRHPACAHAAGQSDASRHSRGRRTGGQPRLLSRRAPHAHEGGRALPAGQGTRHRRRRGLHRGRGLHPGRSPGFRERPRARGGDQCGTVGAGNHFIEVQIVDRIEDAAAAAFGLHAGQICVSRSLERSFGTTCHGAGRALSRTAATKAARGRNIQDELQRSGVVARCHSREGLAEEQPAAYKDVDIVVDIVHRAGLSLKVARLRPLGVIKG